MHGQGRGWRALTLGGLLAADALFLWMFLAADPIEQLADAGRLVGASSDAVASAYLAAARWRHGMAGNSPLYMPGFFVVAVAAWTWAMGRRLRRMWIEGGAIALVALSAAAALCPVGRAAAFCSLAQVTGLTTEGPLPAPSVRAVVAGSYTLFTWTVFVIACQRSIAGRTRWPLLWPAVLTVGLAVGRPSTVGDFTSFWWVRALAGEVDALGSFFAVPAAAWLLVRLQLRYEATRRVPGFEAGPAPTSSTAA